jgi:hypothetical protein
MLRVSFDNDDNDAVEGCGRDVDEEKRNESKCESEC